MKQEDKNYILEQMKLLIGTSLLKIGRLAATGNLSFSSLDEKEYWLRIQTAFRIRTQDKIRIASLDMFEPTQLLKDNPSFNWDTFDWDVQGSNLYDELSEQLKEHYEKPISVQNIALSDFGDLTMDAVQTKRMIEDTKIEIAEIDSVLSQPALEHKEILELWHIKGLSKEKICERVERYSTKTNASSFKPF